MAADEYGLPDACKRPLIMALVAVPEAGLGAAELCVAYSLPPLLREGEELWGFFRVCGARLAGLFGDVPALLSSPERLDQFCALPFAAVRVWLRLDGLVVHSESCVLLALTTWVRQNKPDVARLTELVYDVRVSHLSQPYLRDVLPHLDWFNDGLAAVRGGGYLFRRGDERHDTR